MSKHLLSTGHKIIGWDEVKGLYELTAEGRKETELVRGEERVFDFTLISRHLRWLQGEILTILEATIEDERKLKATKELVKDKISAKISWIYEQCGCPKEGESGLVDPE